MERQAFIQQLEDLTGYEVSKIDWIYRLGENVGDGEPLYYMDCTLQVGLYSGGQSFINLSADNYCEDREECINTILGVFEECDSNFGDLKASTDIDEAVLIMREYLYEYADTLDKPELDSVYYESM